MKNFTVLILLVIILLAALLRLYNLNAVPPSASLDEASIGWNAYSILQTGHDEYGYKFPIILRAYDDWRPALYVYLVIPFIKIFGLDVFAVRLPSVLLSLLVVLGSYFLVKNMLKESKNSEYIALFSTFLLAVSPWSIYISRLGHEVNLGLFFVVFGVLSFLLSQTKRWYLVLSAIFFALSLYSYQSEKIFAPLAVLTLGAIYRKELYKIKKIVFVSIVIGLIVSVPILVASLSPQALIRFKGTSAFDSSNPLYNESAKRLLESRQRGDFIGEILNNRRITSLNIFLSQYFSHFNLQWLFGNRGSESFKTPGLGLLYAFEAPFFLAGIFFLFKNKYSFKTKATISSWVLLSFVAPAVATQAPHAMRSYNVLPMPQILVGIGILEIGKFFPKKPAIILLGILVVSQLYYFWSQYFFVFPKVHSSSFQYPLSKAMPYVFNHHGEYKTVVISNRDNLYESYMFFLFYSKYDPLTYLREGGTRSGGFAETHKIGKYEFRPIFWDEDKIRQKILFVGNPSDFPKDIKTLKEFKDLDGKTSIIITETLR